MSEPLTTTPHLDHRFFLFSCPLFEAKMVMFLVIPKPKEDLGIIPPILTEHLLYVMQFWGLWVTQW